MRFLIKHRASGMLRLQAAQPRMTVEEADLLDEYARRIPGVQRVTVHERTCAVILYFRGEEDEIIRALAAFSYQKAAEEIDVLSHTGRELNRIYKEKIFFHILGRYVKRLYFPAPLRRVIHTVKALPYVAKALGCLFRGEITVDLLDGIAIGVSVLTGDYETAGSVMFLLKLGDYLDEWTRKKSVDDLARSMSLQVDRVWQRTQDGDVLVSVQDIEEGDLIVVNAGCMIPLDGEIHEGEAMVNQASLTGESVPVEKRAGHLVFAGTVVEEGNAVIRVTHKTGSNRYDRIVNMIEESEKMNSETEQHAAHLADRLVPWCLGGSVFTYLLTRNVPRAVSVLMVDFSCALKLTMPLAVLSAMREAGRNRIMVKGGKYMERLSVADTVVFDKTGTLTRACPTVAEVVPFHGNDADEMLRIAACLEEHFPHSMADAVVRAAREKGLDHEEMHSEVDYIVAHGIVTRIGGDRAIIGSYHFVFEDENVTIAEEDKDRFASLSPAYSQLYLAIGGILSAVILISDPLRPEARDVVRGLKEAGFGKTVMITGDNYKTAQAIAAQVGVDEFLAEVLPEDKAVYIRKEQEAGRIVAMIGDGINDAPALSLADLGIAIGSGAAIAREVADITISAEDLRELVYLKHLSDLLMRRIRQNYRTIMTFNGFLIVLGAMGVLPPATSALLHNGSTVVLSLQSMTRLIKEDDVYEST